MISDIRVDGKEVFVADDEPPSGERCGKGCASAASELKWRRSGDLVDHPRWRDWRWQMRNRIRSTDELRRLLPQFQEQSGTIQTAELFPMAVTPYYASLIQHAGADDPIFRMSVPEEAELHDPPFLRDDPLAEERDMPVPGLVHRYPDRALLLVTTTCAAYCRHCTRKRVAGWREHSISAGDLNRAVAYLKAHPEIKDVIISGGDPLTMSTTGLDRILTALRSVASIEIIRIGTRTLVTLPFRVTDELTTMLRRHAPVWINTHFNHPRELTPEAMAACSRLADAGVPLGNQTVLLRGVNDQPRIIEQLVRGLLRMRVRPYYLFQCDLVRGVEHFRTPLSCGIEIMEYLRGRMSGLGIPSFVVDLPDGGGKIPLLPDYIVSRAANHTVLRNASGRIVSYPEPVLENDSCGGPSLLAHSLLPAAVVQECGGGAVEEVRQSEFSAVPVSLAGGR